MFFKLSNVFTYFPFVKANRRFQVKDEVDHDGNVFCYSFNYYVKNWNAVQLYRDKLSKAVFEVGALICSMFKPC